MKKSLLQAAALVSLTALIAGCSASSKADATDVSVVTTMDPVVQATTNAKNTTAVRTVEEAYTAMRDIHAARLAIFDGSGPAAKSFVNDAAAKLAVSKTEAEKIALKTTEPETAGGYIPFDMAMTVSENFTASPAKAAKIKEANEHLSKGDHKKAHEILRLADINVLTTAALLPVDQTMDRITTAANFLEKGDYYAANMVLKSIEDSVIIQAYDMDGKPVVAPVNSSAMAPAQAPSKEVARPAPEKS
tara:strand:- start:324 stop:1064 length:741 start_codon:yes stop_codon:yes gene_type:complete